MALVYADSSALVKLVLDEPESSALRSYLGGADVIGSELVLVEVPRAVRRAVARQPRLPLDLLLDRAAEVVDAVALISLERSLLLGAGALAEPALRALDAIHVVAAAAVHPIDAFLTYDERQAAATRLAGLRTVAPGA